MPLLLCRDFKSFRIVVHQTRRLTIQTKIWTKFLYLCTVAFVSKLYFEVFYKVRRKNGDENMEVDNRKKAKYEKYDNDFQSSVKIGP